MKRLFILACFMNYFFGSTQQSEQKINTQAKTIFIELASINKLELLSTDLDTEVIVKCTNCNTESIPVITNKKEGMTIKVLEDRSKIYGAQRNKFRAGQPDYSDYKISIPKDKEVKVVYNKGNFYSDGFQGNLELHLNHGKVFVQNISNNLNISSYDGSIAISLRKGKLTIENSKGSIINHLKEKSFLVTEQSLKGIYKNGDPEIRIKTVKAKVILSPVITQ